MELHERITKYMNAIPPAVAGAKGHDQTFTAATTLVHGFGLDEGTAMPYFREYSARCDPPWNEAEMIHKIRSAETTTHTKARGHLLSNGQKPMHQHTPPVVREAAAPRFKLSKTPDQIEGIELPKPIENGSRILLQMFKAQEHIRIVTGQYGEDGKDRPKDMGTMLTAAKWLEKLDAAKGNPNKIFKSTGKQPGLFIGINPTSSKRGAEDKSITSFRHALIEFDTIPLEQQWELIKSSNIPCACVIASGGKSVHAWVRINAVDRAEFDERVKILHETFADYGMDTQNRNPARLSRLPGCARGEKRQELLATSIGAESFTAWLSEQEGKSGAKTFDVREFMEYEPTEDQDNLVGRNWLKRKGSMIIAGQSGIGKSSLAMQGAVTWALGQSWFGMKPVKPLKQLLFQAENDFGDLAEQFQGVFDGLGFDDMSQELDQVADNLKVIADATHIGKNFVDELQRQIDKHRPDVVWIDPLLSFIGDDISRQEVCGRFLREWLTPVKDAGDGVAIIFMHHTNKPPADNKSRSSWSALDYAYMGSGSAELVNWARAGAYIEQDKSGLFRLLLTKRGNRSGATDVDGEESTTLWLQRSIIGINWLQCKEPISIKDESEKPKKASKWGKVTDPTKLITADEQISEGQLLKRLTAAGGPSSSSYYQTKNREQRTKFQDLFSFDQDSKKWGLK